ncbi:MAG TPA: RDD family protein [Thermoanaerobaculia bacterium]|nr:RDD family protein [Thermoanaerobaculia bacterium]
MNYAHMGRRLGAVLLDSVLSTMVLSVVFYGKGDLWTRKLEVLFGTVIVIVYEGLMLAARGQTLGKMALRIRVVAADGSPISRQRAWLRAVMRAILGPVWFLDLGAAWFNPHRATIHDIVANTRVIRIER